MKTLQVEILNPKARKLLDDLVQLNLIKIKENKGNDFSDLLKKSRTKGGDQLTPEEIINEVELVRKSRYEIIGNNARHKSRISFLITKNFIELDKLIEDKKITLIFSEEIVDAASRPKFKKYFSKGDIDKIFQHFDQFGSLVIITSNLKICREEKNNFLLNLSIDSQAYFLITVDKDLLVLEEIGQTKILTFKDFLKHF